MKDLARKFNPDKHIFIEEAAENNLKNISLLIPRNQLVVITGVSGSGKSSLAYDTLYAEGQRRYIESLSSYARQFLGELKKRVDSGEMEVAFALYPVSMKQLMDIADNDKIMPPKTTWFEPKLRSGLVIHSLD